MKARQISNRTFVLEYTDGDTNFLINGKNTIYICDTHMGLESMDLLKNFIKNNGWSNKEIIVFNSHYHYDHIWGNCAFQNEKIISQEMCRDRIIERGEYQLEIYSNMYNTTGIEIKAPNITFMNNLEFHDDEIEFIYTPGHTDDSAICIDKRDSIIYVNDLVERPLPHLANENWEQYLETLEMIKALSPQVMVSTHSGIVTEKLLDENILYIKKLLKGEKIEFNDEVRIRVHNNNIKRKLILTKEKEIKGLLGKKFDYKAFKKEFWSILGVEYKDLEREYILTATTPYTEFQEAFKEYISHIVE